MICINTKQEIYKRICNLMPKTIYFKNVSQNWVSTAFPLYLEMIKESLDEDVDV